MADSDTRTLLDTSVQEADVSMTTGNESGSDKSKSQTSTKFETGFKEREPDQNSPELKDMALKMNEHDTDDVTMTTKEDSDNERTELLDRGDSSDSGEDVIAEMTTDSNVDDRIDDMTKR